MRRKRPELWENDCWIFHRDNAPAHNVLSVEQFLAKNRTLALRRAPYSPDLAPFGFFGRISKIVSTDGKAILTERRF